MNQSVSGRRGWIPLLRAALLVGTAAAVLGCDDHGEGDASRDADVDDGGDADTDSPPETDSDVADSAPPPEPYSIELFDRVWISSLSEDDHFQSADAPFELVDAPFESVTLVVDLESPCYPFERWADDPPPPGENWPASCDAFDRNFEFTLDEPVDEGDPPAIELVRAITPFGGPQHNEFDVTDVFNGLHGAHTIRTHISTWSDASGQVSGSAGGWFVSARLDVVPGTPPRQVLAVIPLANTWVRFDTLTENLTFDVPVGATGGRIEYRATGHGGVMTEESVCVGPAEEFCQRALHVFIDEEELDAVDPWREDCLHMCTLAVYEPWGLDYCEENPCGSIRSVRAPRANWCPGDVTPPFVWEPDACALPGEHSFRYEIDDVAEGGSWRVSAAVFVFGE